MAPVLSGLRVSPHRIHISARRRHFKTRISYTLSAAATVTLTIERRVRDREGTHSWVRVHGRIRLAGKAGTNKFTFRGRIGDHTLGRGTYRIILTPGAGGLTGTARSARLVIVG
jgi:hypothetical protein